MTDYTHEDVSDQFTPRAGASVAILYGAVFLLLRASSRRHHVLISLAGALAVVLLRSFLHGCAAGPPFFPRRSVVLEPLVAMFSGRLMARCFLPPDGAIRASLLGERPGAPLRTLFAAAFAAAILGDDAAQYLLAGGATDGMMVLALLSGSSAGSSFTLTGSATNLFVRSVAWDDYSFIDFKTDMVLPFFFALAVRSLPFFLHRRYSLNLYVGVAADEQETEVCSGPTTAADEIRTATAPPADTVGGSGTLEMAGVDAGWSGAATDPDPAPHPAGVPGSRVVSRLAPHGYVVFTPLVLLAHFLPEQRPLFLVAELATAAAAFLASYYWGGRRPHLVLVAVSLGYGTGGDILVVGLCGAAFLLLASHGKESARCVADVDVAPLLILTCQMVLTAALVDTGLPQVFFFGSGPFEDCDLCVYRFAVVVSLLVLVIGGVNSAAIVLATFPYATPYRCIQISWIISTVSAIGWSPVARPKMGIQSRYLMIAVPVTFLSLLGGLFLLSKVHSSLDCSIKLGTC